MTIRIPPITTPVAGEGDDDDPRSINSLWYRYLQSLQQSKPGEGIPEAPQDGKLYGRQDAAWQEVPSSEDVDLGYSANATAGTVSNTSGTGFVVPTFTRQNAGLVPAPITGTDTRFLREDGTWQTAGGGYEFNPNDEINADISRFYLLGGQGAQFVGAGGLTLTGWTVNNADGNNAPNAASSFTQARRLVTAFRTNSFWGARATTTIAPVKIGQNGIGDFSIVLDFCRLPTQLWDGQFFTGASSGSLSDPIESHATDYVGFMRPSTLGNYHTAIRVGSATPTLVDTGIGLGATNGSTIYRFVVSSNNGQVTFSILSYNGTTNRFDVVEYTSTVTSGLPTVTLAPSFGGAAAQNLSVGVQRFVGWARL